MSFGSENPELWNEICKRGILNKLLAQMTRDGFDNADEETVTAAVESLYEIPKVQDALMSWAHDEVCALEQGYWGDRVDEAVMRHELTEDHKMSVVWTKSGDIKEEQPC
jgi:hypothetical protein